MNTTLNLYQRLTKLPWGNQLFSRGLTLRAPYFASIRPLVVECRPSFCRARMRDRRAIRNHIGSINAGAMCTLSELTGGLAVEVTIPSYLRWIPKAMSVEYLKKAKGTITGTCEFDPEILLPGDVQLPLELQDEAGDTVLRARISFYISERPKG
jgi:acyl-coenzyme A thioesterase PaaI-like protein